MQAVELQIDTGDNGNLHFRPLQRSIRGRFDLMRVGEPMARVRAQEWPVIPSQRIGITPDGQGFLIEPLHEPEHRALKEKIERMGFRLEAQVQTFDSIHLPSWQHWLKQAVEAGLATVTKGKLPDKIDGEPRLNFILADQPPSQTDKLDATLKDMTTSFNALTSAIMKLVEAK